MAVSSKLETSSCPTCWRRLRRSTTWRAACSRARSGETPLSVPESSRPAPPMISPVISATAAARTSAKSRRRAAGSRERRSLSLDPRSLCGAPRLEHGAHAGHGLRHRALDSPEVPARERHELHGRRRRHGGVAERLLEQAHLAEEVAGTEIRHVLAVPGDLGFTLLDRHELVGEIAFSHEPATRLHADLLREGRDLGELFVRYVCEQRQRPQAIGVHGSSSISVAATLPQGTHPTEGTPPQDGQRREQGDDQQYREHRNDEGEEGEQSRPQVLDHRVPPTRGFARAPENGRCLARTGALALVRRALYQLR